MKRPADSLQQMARPLQMWMEELEAALKEAEKTEAEADMEDDFQSYDDAGKDAGALRRTIEIMRRHSSIDEASRSDEAKPSVRVSDPPEEAL